MSREEVKIKLSELIEPLVESRGFELVHLEYIPGKQAQLQIFIDREGGITIDHCELINKAVSDLLDYHDPIDHAYTLEVSSPGLERPLTKKEHFDRFAGEKVKIKTSEDLNGRKKFSGRLEGTEKDNVLVRLDNDQVAEIPIALIDRAKLWFTESDKDNLAKGSQEGR